MASSKREKELARQRAVRQAARKQAIARQRKKRNSVVAGIAAALAVVVIGGVALFALRGDGGTDTVVGEGATASAAPSSEVSPVAVPSAQPSEEPSKEPSEEPSAEPTVTAAPVAGTCTYTETGEEPAREVKLPPATGVESKKTYDVTLATDRGDVVFTMDSAKAPCTANNLRSLAHFAYFDDTTCHRLTTDTIYVLQCGDPTGTGSGGPGYQFAEENLEGATYPRGTVAMARTQDRGTNGSQFFLVYKDSGLPPNYTPFGTITKGLDVLDEVAAAGTDNANGPGDGAPKLPVTITTLRATEA